MPQSVHSKRKTCTETVIDNSVKHSRTHYSFSEAQVPPNPRQPPPATHQSTLPSHRAANWGPETAESCLPMWCFGGKPSKTTTEEAEPRTESRLWVAAPPQGSDGHRPTAPRFSWRLRSLTAPPEGPAGTRWGVSRGFLSAEPCRLSRSRRATDASSTVAGTSRDVGPSGAGTGGAARGGISGPFANGEHDGTHSCGERGAKRASVLRLAASPAQTTAQ